jgi:hypothetical protein
VRISTTTLESYRLFRDPDQEWMSEDDMLATIRGDWTPNPKVLLGSAFGKVLEAPERFICEGGYRCGDYFFASDVMAPALKVIDYRGLFEAKATKRYGPYTVVAKADHLLGVQLSEFKTTLSTFDVQKYLDSYQWRFMADIFEPKVITYHVFALSEDTAGAISLRGVESFNVFPYADLRRDCMALVEEFAAYVTAKGLDGFLRDRQAAAEAA